jgi:hypothetical protein
MVAGAATRLELTLPYGGGGGRGRDATLINAIPWFRDRCDQRQIQPVVAVLAHLATPATTLAAEGWSSRQDCSVSTAKTTWASLGRPTFSG